MVRIERQEKKGYFFIKTDKGNITPWKRGQYFIIRFGNNYKGIPSFPFEMGGETVFIIYGEKDIENISNIEGPCGKPLNLSGYSRILFVCNDKGIPAFMNVKQGGKEHIDLLILGSSELAEELGVNYKRINYLEEVREEVNRNNYDLVISAGDNEISKGIEDLNISAEHIACVYTPIRDGTGLCLICRVYVKGEMRLNCVDGRWFIARDIDWDKLKASKKEKAECLRR